MTTASRRVDPILVATDGTSSADKALQAAAELAAASSRAVVVVAVLEPLPLVAADYGLLLPPMETEEARREALTRRVREQVGEIAGAQHDWQVVVHDGAPAATIARVARELQARLIVLGIGHHNILDRMFGGETALHTLRVANTPVLAVSPDFAGLPSRIAVAVDFSDHSARAAREAMQLLPRLESIDLVHVAPRIDLQPDAHAMWMANYGEGLRPAFERFRAALEFPAGVAVEMVTLTGRPSKALLEYARSSNIDLLVTGSRGMGVVDRLLVGSTATGLIRGGQCSVLAVPSPKGSTEDDLAMAGKIAESEWASALEVFTRRNAGRSCTLEVNDPALGAQEQQHGSAFLGAAYDHHDRRVELMFGDIEGSTRHLTRGIGNVDRIDILQDAEQRDQALRIVHGPTQTLLTLIR